MKKQCEYNKQISFVSFLLFVTLLLPSLSMAQQQVISYKSSTPSEGQKYVLHVDDEPFYMTSIQFRMDKLNYILDWSYNDKNALMAQAASDGFNTVGLVLHWYEIEPTKNNFDWTILDEYLSLANTNGLKVEILWFGANSGGKVQWLGRVSDGTWTHLRTPDYVMYSPHPDSTNTTSDYTILRSYSDYTLDLSSALQARETYVVGQLMQHINAWDSANGNNYTVIGIQIGNEVRGPFTSNEVMSYLSGVGSAVKNSEYVVWTRTNCIRYEHEARINANEALRSGSGTNIDFVGVDLYGRTEQQVRTDMPVIGENYRMVMELGAETTNAAQLVIAALSSDQCVSYYDMCGTDGRELYDHDTTSFFPHGNYIADVRTVNYLLNTDIFDIATKANGYSLYVHNWEANSTAETLGTVEYISFVPSSTSSQGISIKRNSSEIVLMNTKGGTFNYPSSLQVTGASKGYFDSNNNWVNQGSVSYTSTSITPPIGLTVRLTYSGEAEYYNIVNRNSGKSLRSTGGNIVQYTLNPGYWTEQFSQIDLGNGYYQFKNRNSSKCLRALNGDIIEYECNPGYWSEQFQIIDLGNGYYQLKNRNSGNCVQVADGSLLDNANIEEGTPNSGWWRQQFSIISTSTKSAYLATSITSLDELSNRLTIYPNPVSSSLSIDLSDDFKGGRLTIFNMNGKIISETLINSSKYKLDVANFVPGMYMIRVNNMDYSTMTKFIKE